VVNTSGHPPRSVQPSRGGNPTQERSAAGGGLLPPGREIREVEERVLRSGRVVRTERGSVTYFDPARGVYVSEVLLRLPLVEQGAPPSTVGEVHECATCGRVLGVGAVVSCQACGDDVCRADSRELEFEGVVVSLCARCAEAVTTPKLVQRLRGFGRGVRALLWGSW
jgi:hypothetical protein